MPSSPTLTDFNYKLKDRYKFRYSISTKSYSYLIIIYPIIVLCALFIIKPKMILKDNNSEDVDNNSDISYDKLIIWYLCLQLPIFFYVFIRMLEKDES